MLLTETFSSYLVAYFVCCSSIVTFARITVREGIMTGSALIAWPTNHVVITSEKKSSIFTVPLLQIFTIMFNPNS